MPYIEQHQRRVPLQVPVTIGELNYRITLLCLDWLGVHGKSYKNINAVVGALECAKLEFYRRLAAVYEDTKIQQNGDVYPHD
jgi:hypothetical protein